MNKRFPTLIVVAGCNGSGKSTYSKSLMPDSAIVPFDYDWHFLSIYNSKPDSELKDKICHHLAFERLELSVGNAIKEHSWFSYETNFNSTPMHWPQLFKENNYKLHMFFFCLNSPDEAKRRVRIRYENGGHFVPDHEVEERYKLGYSFLDQYFSEFDVIHLFDSSAYDKVPSHILTLENGRLSIIGNYPLYLNSLLPKITELVHNTGKF